MNQDHDDVIRNKRDMEIVCSWMKKIDNKLDNVIEKKVDINLFWKVIGILVTIMIISGGVVIANKTSLSENRICIEQLQEEVK